MLNDPRAVDPLVKALVDSSLAVRQAAATVLWKSGQAKWKDWIKGDEQDLVRLAQSGEPTAPDLLIMALGDKWKYDRFGAAWALGYTQDPRAVEGLLTHPLT